MLLDARDRKFERVVVLDRTRLARRYDDLKLVLEFLDACGVRVFIGDIPNACGVTKVLIAVIGAVDELFLDQLRAKTRAGLRKARENGTYLGAPFAGFDRQGQPTAFALLLEEEAKTYNREELAVRHRMSYFRVCRLLKNMENYRAGTLHAVDGTGSRRRRIFQERQKHRRREFEWFLRANLPLK